MKTTWIYLISFKHINGLVQDCSMAIANALEILQYCTKPLIFIQDNSWIKGCFTWHSVIWISRTSWKYSRYFTDVCSQKIFTKHHTSWIWFITKIHLRNCYAVCSALLRWTRLYYKQKVFLPNVVQHCVKMAVAYLQWRSVGELIEARCRIYASVN